MKAMVLTLVVIFASSCAVKKTPEQLAKHPEEAPPSHAPTANTQTSIEAKELAASEQAASVVEVLFKRGSSGLDSKQNAKLFSALKKASESPKSVKIVSWADQEYPGKGSAAPSAAQVALAKQRGETLEKFIRKNSSETSIENFNMAERPSAFADWYSSTDASLKRNLERAGFATPKASRAFVLFNSK